MLKNIKAAGGIFDLGKMLKDLMVKDIPVKACGTCKIRCGIYKNGPYFQGIKEAKITELAKWVKKSIKLLRLDRRCGYGGYKD